MSVYRQKSHKERRNDSNPRSLVQAKEKRQLEAKVRQAGYDALTLQQKIDKQVKAGHNGKQLKKLLALKEAKKQ